MFLVTGCSCKIYAVGETKSKETHLIQYTPCSPSHTYCAPKINKVWFTHVISLCLRIKRHWEQTKRFWVCFWHFWRDGELSTKQAGEFTNLCTQFPFVAWEENSIKIWCMVIHLFQFRFISLRFDGYWKNQLNNKGAPRTHSRVLEWPIL